MKIGSLPAVAMEQYQNNRVKTKKAETASMGADSVELSGASRLFEQALTAVKETPEARMDRVEAIRAQISAGTYRINAAAIADRMLAGTIGETPGVS
ncbi:MAG: flagellar biosynthesis anti-sigma factor FlgM [Oscillospiraceae bacterium]|nr:flagellar biosynthesis anti-sigma factor FlgM [Oscillospiraceae bacterium]